MPKLFTKEWYLNSMLIGHTGFVGSTIHYTIPFFQYKINSKSTDEEKNEIINNNNQFSCIICAGISATKWFANQNPEKDLFDIQKMFAFIQQLATKEIQYFVLISTIDIYNSHEPYGKNRIDFENKIIKLFEPSKTKLVILRLPALFGFFMKKNALFDLIQVLLNNKTEFKSPNLLSTFQWYPIDRLAFDLKSILSIVGVDVKKLYIINLFSSPIQWSVFVNLVLQVTQKNISIIENQNIISYDCPLTKDTFTSLNTIELLDYLKKFITYLFYQNETIIEKKCSISTIFLCSPFLNTQQKDYSLNAIVNNHWSNLNEFSLKTNEIKSDLEIAPYSFFKNDSEWYFKTFDEYKNKIYSMQSILYPDDHLFSLASPEGQNNFLERIGQIIHFANRHNIKVIVYGSPKTRYVPDSEMNNVVRLFQNIDLLARKFQVQFCIEPNAQLYGCSFLTTMNQTINFIKQVRNENNNSEDGLFAHFDIGSTCLEFNGDNIESIYKLEWLPHLKYIKHVHISCPFLQFFHPLHSLFLNSPENNNDLKFVASQFLLKLFSNTNNYNGRFSIEMVPSKTCLVDNSLNYWKYAFYYLFYFLNLLQ